MYHDYAAILVAIRDCKLPEVMRKILFADHDLGLGAP